MSDYMNDPNKSGMANYYDKVLHDQSQASHRAHMKGNPFGAQVLPIILMVCALVALFVVRDIGLGIAAALAIGSLAVIFKSRLVKYLAVGAALGAGAAWAGNDLTQTATYPIDIAAAAGAGLALLSWVLRRKRAKANASDRALERSR